MGSERAALSKRKPDTSILPLAAFGGNPDEDDALDDEADGRILRHHKKPGTLVSSRDELAEMTRQRVLVVGDENPAVVRGEAQHVRVLKAIEMRVARAAKVDCRLSSSDAGPNGVPEVVIGLEADVDRIRVAP